MTRVLTPEGQWFTQLVCAAVAGWALGRLLVELGRGGVAALTRRYHTRGGTQ